MTFFKPLLASVFGLCAMTQVAIAQQVTATTVVGEGGSGAYPVTVVGSDGRTYNCRAAVEMVGGQQVRRCVPAAAVGNGFGAQAGPVAGAVVLLGLVAVAASDGS